MYVYVYVSVIGHVIFAQMESITTYCSILCLSAGWAPLIRGLFCFCFFHFILNILSFLPRDIHKLRKSRLTKTKRAMEKCTNGQEPAP